MQQKVIIVGSGPAGYTAAIYSARAGLAPLLIEGMQPGGQLTTTTDIENFPGFPDGMDGFSLMELMKSQAVRFGTTILSGIAETVLLDRKPYRVILDNKKEYETESLIICTGASARYLGLESEQKLIGRGVSGCATCDGAFYRDVPVAVVGGGDSAVEEALFLTRFASKVYLIHRRDELRASKIMAARAVANEKIEICWNSVVEEVFDVTKNLVTGVLLRNVQTDTRTELNVDGLFMGIGHSPNTALLQGALEIDDKGYLVTQSTCTAYDGVFAAGDVQDSVYRQAISAAGTGCMAALEAERYLQALGQ